MKYIITIIFLFLFVACKDCKKIPSTAIDKRCEKIRDEASKKGKETGVCYQPKENELVFAKDGPRLDPDHEACNALLEEALDKCDALPPPGPDDIIQTSGSTFGGGCK